MTRDPAKRRYFAIQALRWVGLALVLAGLAAVRGRIGLPQPLGYALVVAGLIGTLIAPPLLARRWKSPPP